MKILWPIRTQVKYIKYFMGFRRQFRSHRLHPVVRISNLESLILLNKPLSLYRLSIICLHTCMHVCVIPCYKCTKYLCNNTDLRTYLQAYKEQLVNETTKSITYPFNMRKLIAWLIYSSTANIQKLFDSCRFCPVCYRPAIMMIIGVMPGYRQEW